MIRVTVLVAAVLLLARPVPGEAEVYRWVDERGVPHFTDGIESVPERHRATAVPLGLRNTPTSSSTPAAPSTSAPAVGVTQIKFTRGRAIIVDATLNGRTTVKLILDTGADKTVITPRALAAAGASLTQGPRGEIRSATGTAVVQGVTLESLEVGEARVARILVIAHDVERAGVDGLLGRDFLDQFRLSIDADNGVATLAPRKP